MSRKKNIKFDNLKIGPFTWTYEETKEKSSKSLGECSFENLLITVQSDLKKDIKISTIFHELVHSFFASTGYIPKNEEAITDILACQLLFFLRNNPEFLDYLKKLL